MSHAIEITDPRHVPRERPNAFERLALSLIRDERDLPFVTLSASMFLACFTAALALYIPGVFRWYLGVAYLVMLFGCFFDRYILMLHNTSHRPLYRKDKAWLNHFIPWVLAPFAGQSPNTYYAHHIGMHHPENNLPDDLSTTMRFQRDSFLHFMRYFLRFFFGWYELARYHKERGHLRRVLFGEGLFTAAVSALLWLSFWPTMLVFGLPFLLARFLMMAGNWGQHAFVDGADPSNPYLNSIDCVNTRYNQRCFNDGYPIGHHEKATRHWTDRPANFEAKRQLYVEHDAIVFEGVDFFMVWLYLMLGRYDWLARRAVHFGPEPESEEAYIAFLRSRARAIPV